MITAPKLLSSEKILNRTLVCTGHISDQLIQPYNEKTPQSVQNCGVIGHLWMALDYDMAEEQGFEPWVELPPQRFSRPSRSTSPALLQSGHEQQRICTLPGVKNQGIA